MRKILLLILVLTFSVVQAQNLDPKKDLAINSLFLKLDEETPEMVKFINTNENKHVLDLNSDFALRYPDTIQNPEKIKFVSLSFRSNEDLINQIDALKKFPNIEYLEIKTAVQFRKSDIKKNLSLPKNLQTLTQLRYLQISGSYHIDYSTFFETIRQISQLEYLGLPYIWEDLQLPDSFLKLTQLKGIKVEGFKEFFFPNDMSTMENLQSIVMVPEQYQNIGNEFQKFLTLPHLKQLTFYYGRFSNEDLIYFQKFKELKSLSFTNFEFEDIQKLIDNLPENNTLENLSLLNLKTNSEITDFSKLKNLERLDISSYSKHKISLHESLYELENLKSLTVHTDSLFSLSEKLGKLKNLEELNFSYNNISSLPKSIGDLKKLKHLELSQNNIASLPKSFSQLTSLKILDMSNNSLAMLPVDFGNLTHLTSLKLHNNNLAELPVKFGQLVNLELLNLNVNYLKALPEDFGNLTMLIRLNVEDNFIKKLPDSFPELDKLRYLQLSFNDLQNLPEDFGNLKGLEEIYLGGNRNNSRPSTYQVKSGIKIDESRPERAFNEIRKFPQSFSKLENLKRVYLREMKTLEEVSLFNLFFKIPSKKYQLDISKTGISSLPQTGWENFLAGSLYMGGNVITQIPATIVNAPYLSSFTFNLSEKDGLSYNLRGKAELNAFFEEKGFIDFASLPRNEEIAKAYLENAYNRKYTQGNNILELMDKAFLLDSTYTEKNIRNSDYADALLNAGNYEKAIKYYDRAIAMDTARGPYILNFIVPNFQSRAIAHLKTGDTLSAIKGLGYVSKRFSSGDWAKAGVLASAIGKDSLASQYFKNGEKFYKDYIKRNLEAGKIDYSYQLSLLELYIVKEDLSKASNYLSLLDIDSIVEKDKQLLLEYLKQILVILQDKVEDTDLNRLSSKISNADLKISFWSFDLINLWLDLTRVKKAKKEIIKNLTEAMENKG